MYIIVYMDILYVYIHKYYIYTLYFTNISITHVITKGRKTKSCLTEDAGRLPWSLVGGSGCAFSNCPLDPSEWMQKMVFSVPETNCSWILST